MRYHENQVFMFLMSLVQINYAAPNVTFDQMEDAVMKFRVVPEVIKIMPKHPLEVVYLGNFISNFGNQLDAHELEYAPHKVKWPCELPSYYTLIMIDPDVPSASNPTHRSHLQWLVVNIKAIFMSTGREIAQYLTPDPEEGTGVHRCIFILYKQMAGESEFNETNYNDPRNLESRYHFSVEKFAKKYNLGDPHAINFFTSTWKFVPSTKEPWYEDEDES